MWSMIDSVYAGGCCWLLREVTVGWEGGNYSLITFRYHNRYEPGVAGEGEPRALV